MTYRVFVTCGVSLCEQKKDGERTQELQVSSRTRDDVEEQECEVEVRQVTKNDNILVKATSEEAASRPETRPESVGQNTTEIPASDLRSAAEQKAEEKMGKQSLLELLRVMKVDTTTKTKLKSLRKVTSGQDSVLKQKSVVMESTSSMFQQATTSHR